MLPEVTDYCRLILLRHPELAPEHAQLAVGGGPATLGRRGQDQVKDWLHGLASLQLDVVYAADQPQCSDSGRALAAHRQVPIHVDPRLNDQNLGEWQGQAWDDLATEHGDAIREFFASFGEATPPGGESLGSAVERMLMWWQEVAPDARGKCLAVVTSGAMLTGFATAMLGMRLSRSVSLNLPHGGLGVLDCFANGARIATWNPGAMSQPS